MDVSPIQLVSPAAALIPFLEHDDANRALMGSNMQRQAVPLLLTEAPLVGTGLEGKVAEDSGALVLARRAGVVEFVSGEMIAVRYEREPDETPSRLLASSANLDVYRLTKFRRSNQDTCLNQRPVVAGRADGQEGRDHRRRPGHRATASWRSAATCSSAFMPWGGYNFEDAILVCEKLIKDDVFTSIHIEEFELQVRDTKRGVEEITREIPNVGRGRGQEPRRGGRHPHRRAGAAGRHPGRQGHAQGRAELSPEERLLKAIFGDKAGDVRDASLKAPPGHGRHRHRHQGLLAPGEGREHQEAGEEEDREAAPRRPRRSATASSRCALAEPARAPRRPAGQRAHVASTGEVLARAGQKFAAEFLAEHRPRRHRRGDRR